MLQVRLEVASAVEIAMKHLPSIPNSMTSNSETRRSFSAMTKEFVLLLLFSGSVCVAQTTLTTPALDSQQNPDNTSMRNSGRTQPSSGPQLNTQYGGIPDLSRDATEIYPPLYATPLNQPAQSSSRIVGPLRTKSEFQQYAEDAIGRQLPVYGRQLFDQVPSTFAPVENVPVPADYVLGPDDQLLIRAWGKIELNSRVTIDRNGQINLPRVGTVNVAGIRYSQVESYLRSAIGAMFKDFELKFAVYNLFDRKYESNGYTYSYYYDGNFTTQNYYYPQAGINWLTGVSLKF